MSPFLKHLHLSACILFSPLNSLLIDVLYVPNLTVNTQDGGVDGSVPGFLPPSHTFCLSLSPLLSLSLASALLPADEYMNEIKTLRQAHRYTLSHTTQGHKHFINFHFSECEHLLTFSTWRLLVLYGRRGFRMRATIMRSKKKNPT